jgi:hypothetical protein
MVLYSVPSTHNLPPSGAGTIGGRGHGIINGFPTVLFSWFPMHIPNHFLNCISWSLPGCFKNCRREKAHSPVSPVPHRPLLPIHCKTRSSQRGERDCQSVIGRHRDAPKRRVRRSLRPLYRPIHGQCDAGTLFYLPTNLCVIKRFNYKRYSQGNFISLFFVFSLISVALVFL